MPQPPSSNAGGFLVAVGVLVGAGVGLLLGQATPGALIGLAAGSLAAVLVWQRDRRR
ncbi:hypothetical protein [Sphingomonas rubra]|uniref:Glycine zipper n=1 Tax=Sphingomonas rubra TaxID=634430 RepID=A0A1I5PPL2_9SPHN|nr:hypothetical protein [Sphingomonas rubra]SFP35975.1 hypothetical protein SAMN04488241_101147 [Sphingomonas rubra]